MSLGYIKPETMVHGSEKASNSKLLEVEGALDTPANLVQSWLL